MYKTRLKAVRDEKEITQQVIADYLKIHRGRYSQYETEKDLIPIKHLVKICEFFQVSIDYILGFSNKKSYQSISWKIDREKSKIRLKSFRKEQHLTQESLAKMLNISPSTIAEYERGRNIIATPFLYTICKNFGVSADYLLGKSDEEKFHN